MFHKPNIPALLARVAQSEVEHLLRFRTHVEDHHLRELEDLPRKWEDLDPEDAASLTGDDRYFLEEILKMANQLAIIALYRVVELNTKSLMESVLPNAKPREFSTIDGLRDVLAKKFSVDLSQVPSYDPINELRLITNAIKHEGKVDEKLATYPGWVKGEELAGLDAVFDRLAPHVPKYIEALASKVT